MFSFSDCLKKAFLQAISKKPDYEIILSAASWVEKGVLIEADIAEIQTAIDEQYEESQNIENVVEPNVEQEV